MDYQHTQQSEPFASDAYAKSSYHEGVSRELNAPLRDSDAHTSEYDEETGAPLTEGKTGVLGSVFAYTCTCVGAGVLSIPGALQQVGWMGMVLMVIVGLACAQTGKWLVACQFARPGTMLKTYEDIGEQAMGPRGRQIVAFFQAITLFGVCTIFLIIIGGNMHSLIERLSLHDWVFLFGVILIPVAWIKTMNEVAYLAIFGVFASLIVAALVIIKGFIRAHSPEAGAVIHYDTFNMNGLSQAINIIAFSFGGHSVLPNIAAHLIEPQKNYVRVTGLSYFMITCIYILTAAGGYAGWGTGVDSQILNNMDIHEGVVKFAVVAITLHVVMAYPIPLNPLSLALERILGIDKKVGKAELVSRIICRTCLVLLTIFIASVVPYFGDILNLVSSLSIVVVAFVLPPIFYYLLYRDTHQFTLSEILLMGPIVFCGIATSVIGIYYSIKGLISDVQADPSPFKNFF